ncbi:hypothetical protein LINPERPRIM_LOCUS5049, partial [Linum perenne]
GRDGGGPRRLGRRRLWELTARRRRLIYRAADKVPTSDTDLETAMADLDPGAEGEREADAERRLHRKTARWQVQLRSNAGTIARGGGGALRHKEDAAT